MTIAGLLFLLFTPIK